MASDDPIPIVFACNGRYVEQTAVALHSVLAHRSRGERTRLHVLGLELSLRQLQRLRSVGERHANCKLCVENADRAATAGSYSACYSAAANLRLSIPDLFPQSRRALWLDSDILVVDSLEPLLAWDLGNCYLAAVREVDATGQLALGQRLNLPEPANYFNSGVLLLNLEAMRRDGIHRRALQLLRSPDAGKRLRFPDQDALNLVAHGRVQFLPLRWNLMANTLQDNSSTVPALIHFAGGKKPWDMLIASGKRRDLCQRYLRFEKSLCPDRRRRLFLFLRRFFLRAHRHCFGLRDLVRLVRYASLRRLRRRRSS